MTEEELGKKIDRRNKIAMTLAILAILVNVLLVVLEALL